MIFFTFVNYIKKPVQVDISKLPVKQGLLFICKQVNQVSITTFIITIINVLGGMQTSVNETTLI